MCTLCGSGGTGTGCELRWESFRTRTLFFRSSAVCLEWEKERRFPSVPPCFSCLGENRISCAGKAWIYIHIRLGSSSFPLFSSPSSSICFYLFLSVPLSLCLSRSLSFSLSFRFPFCSFWSSLFPFLLTTANRLQNYHHGAPTTHPRVFPLDGVSRLYPFCALVRPTFVFHALHLHSSSRDHSFSFCTTIDHVPPPLFLLPVSGRALDVCVLDGTKGQDVHHVGRDGTLPLGRSAFDGSPSLVQPS